jgi:hypothetical protein
VWRQQRLVWFHSSLCLQAEEYVFCLVGRSFNRATLVHTRCFCPNTSWPIALLHNWNPFGHNILSWVLLILTNVDSEIVFERTKAARSVENRHISLKDVSELSVHQIRLIQKLMVFFDLPILTLRRFLFLPLSVSPHEEPSHQYEIQRDQNI